MRAARCEDLRLAVQRADGRCQRRVYYPGIGLAACSLPSRKRDARITEGEAEALEVWIGLVGAEPVARALGIADTALDQVRHCGPVTARLAERVRAGLVPRG